MVVRRKREQRWLIGQVAEAASRSIRSAMERVCKPDDIVQPTLH